MTGCQFREFGKKPVSIFEKSIFMNFVEVIPVFMGIDFIINCKYYLGKNFKNQSQIFYLHLMSIVLLHQMSLCPKKYPLRELNAFSGIVLLLIYHTLMSPAFHPQGPQLLPEPPHREFGYQSFSFYISRWPSTTGKT